jgi:hypothetical protein
MAPKVNKPVVPVTSWTLRQKFITRMELIPTEKVKLIQSELDKPDENTDTHV